MNAEHPWLNRDDPRYDPNRIGATTEAKVVAALVAAGKALLLPHLCVPIYDLVIDELDGSFTRVQCKTGRLSNGAVVFRTFRLRAAHRETGWQRRASTYVGLVDYFGVYCPENDKVYLVPIEVTTTRNCYLRVSPTRNNQTKRIRWADDYLVRPIDPTLVFPPAESLLFEEMGP